jgi:localization factor PodJL
MRAELPWNVAGIPPEAREAARAAARREGLSVGEWLTRRILRGLSDLGEEPTPERDASLDSWGLPQSTASRRQTDEMLSRVNRSESESGDTWRRVEEQLRGVARRLDSSERSQSESNRVLSRTAAEMNIAAREQSQAFEQISTGMENLNRRLDALENSRTHEALKDAVKGLHLGLTRLADQISNTASQSASQIAMVAGNLEQVASRLVDVRADTEDAARTLEQRLATVEQTAQSGASALNGAVERLENRLAIIEKSAGEAIGHGIAGLEQRLHQTEQKHDETVPVLERIEQRLGEVESVAGERLAPGLDILSDRIGAAEQSAREGLEKLEQRIGFVEQTATDMQGLEHLARRLDAVEKSGELAAETIETALERLQSHSDQRGSDQSAFEQHAGHVDAALERLEGWVDQLHNRVAEPPVLAPETMARLENIEKSLTSLAARLEQPEAALESSLMELSHRIDALEQNHDEIMQELRGLQKPDPSQAALDGFAERAPVFTPQPAQDWRPPVETDMSVAASDPPPLAEPEPSAARGEDNRFADLGQVRHDQTFDRSPREEADYSHHASDDMAERENFLSAARRSARAASDRVESEIRSRNFAWNTQEAESEPRRRPRLLMLGVLVLVTLAALAAGLILSQHQRTVRIVPVPSAKAPPAENPPLAVVTPPPARVPAEITAPPKTPVAAPVQPSGIKPPATLTRATEMAKAGNMLAQTILGLRALDGMDGTKANPAEAARWLSLAAEKGQAVAQYRYATMLERGQGLAADPVRALQWYEAAANQGNRKAMHNLAVAYAGGTGTGKDMTAAVQWFGRAAGLGLSDSQFNLAVLYERGDGVPRSLSDAYKWYAIAAAQGDREARQRLNVLRAGLDPVLRSAAEREAAGFRAAPLSRAANLPPELGDLKN